MKNIFKSTLLLALGLGFMASCESDNDSNPVLQSPTVFVLNNPVMADQPLDMANCKNLELSCSQPDYGFPVSTTYKVQMSLNADMSGLVELDESFTNSKINADAALIAPTLTNMLVEAGKSEADFPISDLAVYFRVRAYVSADGSNAIEGTEILSNIVSLNKVHLAFSLPPVNLPEKLYLIGDFCGWNWDACLTMTPVNGTDNVFWSMVYISTSGVKFNTATAWNGGEVGFAGINVGGDLAGEIVEGGGNIASTNGGWYLMIVTASISGRDIIYDVQFNKPEVYLIGATVGGKWDELLPEGLFTVPADANGEFVSPVLPATPGDDSGCVRAYVKIPGYDWWKSEFMVFDKKLVYRGLGGDQERVGSNAGDHLYINFTNGTGRIEP